jgi:hypothetical protein
VPPLAKIGIGTSIENLRSGIAPRVRGTSTVVRPILIRKLAKCDFAAPE